VDESFVRAENVASGAQKLAEVPGYRTLGRFQPPQEAVRHGAASVPPQADIQGADSTDDPAIARRRLLMEWAGRAPSQHVLFRAAVEYAARDDCAFGEAP
jgi:hypothetical protein